MSQPLRADLLATGHYAVRAMSLALTGTAVAMSLLLPRHREHVAAVPAPAPAIEAFAATAPPVRMTSHEAAPPPAPAPRGGDFAFVFETAGATYLKLAELQALPRHGTLRMHEADGVVSGVATVREAALPAAYRGWAGRAVVVDGRCTAHVTGFAIVARLTGDPDYAGETATTWNARSLLAHGSVVLAARLDRCAGSYARDAALPPIVVPVEVESPELAARARAALLASPAASAAQHDWSVEFGQTGRWADAADVVFTTHVLRHPNSGVTFVSVLAHRDHACGDADVNVWGLFRVARDGSLTALQLRHLDELDEIDQLIDVDGDGTLEVLGKPWLGLDRVLERADGHELDELSLPFYGCPC